MKEKRTDGFQKQQQMKTVANVILGGGQVYSKLAAEQCGPCDSGFRVKKEHE